MFLNDELSPRGPLAIPQASHAWMAWQIARHWGNRRFARPTPAAEVLAAVLLHDSGWTAFDAAPVLDPAGRPRTFDAMETPVHLEIWRESVRRAAQASRYVGLLVADHHRMLAARKLADLEARDDAEGAALTRGFAAEMAATVAAWETDLAGDPRYEHVLDGPGRRANAMVLAAADRISVWLCAGMPFPFDLPAVGRRGEELTVTVRLLAGGRLRLDPWPLEGRGVAVHCEGRRLPAVRFGSAAELHDVLADAPVERLRFELLRASASGAARPGRG